MHVFTSGDEAELFLNGKSLGRKKKEPYEYRLRWDDVKYEPGELRAVAFKDGRKCAEDIVRSEGEAVSLRAVADRAEIIADGKDLSFITVMVTDKEGLFVPRSDSRIKFSIEGPGEIIATDNGDQTDMESFASDERNAFSGMALAIVRSEAGSAGIITVIAESHGLNSARIEIRSK